MSENLFTFPEGNNAPEDGSIFGANPFTDLGSDADSENPFLGMDAGSSQPEEAPAPAEPPVTAAPVAESAPAQETPQPAPAAPAPTPAPAPKRPKQAKTPPANSGSEENPLMAAMDLQEAQNARKAAEPIFAQRPVFSYNGNEEPIENVDQTFEELRLAKADDFPEFDEAQSISWRVTYGKISKTVDKPRKVKISDFKREIESSKEFMDGLKKSKDKSPKCIVKPTVTMQKKGITGLGYKGVFTNMEEARQSGKTICFIPGRSGQVYERRVNAAGEFITPTDNITVLDDIRAGFKPALPLIPHDLMEQAVSLFRCMMTAGADHQPLEALVHIYWDKENEEFFLHVPHQVVGKASVDAMLDDAELLDDERYIHYADLHSHNDMAAVFSKTDDQDERANRVYMVVGRLDRYYPEISVRICNGGRFQTISPKQVLEPAPLTAFPAEWLNNIQRYAGGEELEAAA